LAAPPVSRCLSSVVVVALTVALIFQGLRTACAPEMVHVCRDLRVSLSREAAPCSQIFVGYHRCRSTLAFERVS
jgi:hypothetical protein